MEKTKITLICDRIALFSLYGIAFFLPISKAIIEVFIYLAIASFLVKKILSGKIPTKIPFNLACFIYLFVCFFSIFISSNPQISIRSFFGKVLTNLTLLFVVADTLNTERKTKNFIFILALASLLLGIDGIYQHFTHRDFIRNRYNLQIPRIYATFPTPNDFGCYLICVIPFMLVNLFIKFKYKITRFFYAGLFLLLFTCLILTVSRGSWFAFIGIIFFMSIWSRPLGLLFLIISIFILATQKFYYPIFKWRLDNFFVFQDPSSKDRMLMWSAAWKMLMSRPLLGLGLGTFMFNFKNFVAQGYLYSAPYAHNCYLQIATEIGIIGLVSFLAILAVLFFNGIGALNKGKKTFFWYILLASLTAILGFSVQMAVDTNFYNLDLGSFFWLIMGISVSAIRNIKAELKN
ncbi:MAG: O-antigen ligase family protein [Candidatus Omnitrophica bacterium]|nr:O-antigen ligase family protein [Candidatus Omnitrophota bacterium]